MELVCEEFAKLGVSRVEDIIRGVKRFQDAFNEYNPDLVLLDLMLPGKDGYELCYEMRKIKEVPILMITAKNAVSDKVLGLGLGADDFITKPFDPSELVARVITLPIRPTAANIPSILSPEMYC